jgi:hypothetical protein
VRETGVARQEAALETLMVETRTAFRQENPVLELNFLSMFPFTYLRMLPGADVATGVSTYHFADVVRALLQIVPKKRVSYRKNLPRMQGTMSFIVPV